MTKRFRWTPELDAELKELIAMRMTSFEAARHMGLKREAVKKRSVKIGVRFGRYTKLSRGLTSDHRPADERSGEILRAHGWRI